MLIVNFKPNPYFNIKFSNNIKNYSINLEYMVKSLR